MSHYGGCYPVHVGSQRRNLPLVPVSEDAAIALLMTIDQGVRFMEQAGRDLADLVADLAPQVVATNATLGIPIAIELTRSLGLDDYLVMQKTPKAHLGDALVEPVTAPKASDRVGWSGRSITTDRDQVLRLDRARIRAVEGKRVVLVDDVISTGASIAAALALLRAAGADVVGVGVLLAEGTAWRERLGTDAPLVRSLGLLPGFAISESGWTGVWE